MNHEEEINKVLEEFESGFCYPKGHTMHEILKSGINRNQIETFLRTTCKRMWDAGFQFGLDEKFQADRAQKSYEKGHEQGFLSAIDYAVKLSDEIEDSNTTLDEWRAFKRFRNELRDRATAESGPNTAQQSHE